MTDIIDIQSRKNNTSPTEPPARPEMDVIDDFILKMIAGWKVARANQAIVWAEDDLAIRHGTT
jgi:hypothetical protein